MSLLVALIVAIDPGVNGGLALLDQEGVVTVQKMPGTDYEVVSFLVEVSSTAKEIDCYLEEPPLYAGKNIPGSAIGKLMWNTGVLYGAAVCLGWKMHRVRPAIWQKARRASAQRPNGRTSSRPGPLSSFPPSTSRSGTPTPCSSSTPPSAAPSTNFPYA